MTLKAIIISVLQRLPLGKGEERYSGTSFVDLKDLVQAEWDYVHTGSFSEKLFKHALKDLIEIQAIGYGTSTGRYLKIIDEAKHIGPFSHDGSIGIRKKTVGKTKQVASIPKEKDLEKMKHVIIEESDVEHKTTKRSSPKKSSNGGSKKVVKSPSAKGGKKAAASKVTPRSKTPSSSKKPVGRPKGKKSTIQAVSHDTEDDMEEALNAETVEAAELLASDA